MKICEVGGKGILLPLFGEAEQVGNHRELMDVRSVGCLKLILGGLSPRMADLIFFVVGVACN